MSRDLSQLFLCNQESQKHHVVALALVRVALKPSGFGWTIALCVLNGTDLFCLGYGVRRHLQYFINPVMLPLGHRDCNCPDKPKTNWPSPYREAV